MIPTEAGRAAQSFENPEAPEVDPKVQLLQDRAEFFFSKRKQKKPTKHYELD